MQLSISVERSEERVLERRVLGRLLQVAVHLARRREDALDTGGGGGACGLSVGGGAGAASSSLALMDATASGTLKFADHAPLSTTKGRLTSAASGTN